MLLPHHQADAKEWTMTPATHQFSLNQVVLPNTPQAGNAVKYVQLESETWQAGMSRKTNLSS